MCLLLVFLPGESGGPPLVDTFCHILSVSLCLLCGQGPALPGLPVFKGSAVCHQCFAVRGVSLFVISVTFCEFSSAGCSWHSPDAV